MNINATIVGIETRQVQNKAKTKMLTFQKAVFDNGQKVDIGFNKDKLQVGQKVSLDIQPSKYGDFELATTATVTNMNSPPTSPSTKPQGTSSYGAKPFPVPATHGDMSIIRQSALKAAVDIVNTLTSATGGKKDLKDQDQADRAIALAYKFAAFSSGNAEITAAKAILKNPIEQEIDDNAEG